MKRKIYVLPAILGLGLILSASVLAQSGSVSGTVTESSRGLALSGASVKVEGSPNVAVTDGSGRFVLLGVAAGKAKLTVSYLGFEDVTEEVTVTAGQTTTWDPSMSVAAQSYSVTVTSDADLTGQARALNDQKNSINQVNLVAADQIGSFPDPNAAEAIQRVPGITVQRDQGEGRYVLIRGTEPRLSDHDKRGPHRNYREYVAPDPARHYPGRPNGCPRGNKGVHAGCGRRFDRRTGESDNQASAGQAAVRIDHCFGIQHPRP